MKKLSLFLLIALISFSCSKDDEAREPDIIVGKWKLFKEFDGEEELEIDPCRFNLIVEYKENKTIEYFQSSTIEVPDNCLPWGFQLYLTWINKGEREYEIRYLDNPGIIWTFYKEGKYLAQERPNFKKQIFEPYEE